MIRTRAQEDKEIVGAVTYDLYTAGSILDEMRSIDNAIKSLGNDMSVYAGADTEFRNAYAVFWREWNGFYERLSQGWTSWLERGLFDSARDKVLEYRDRLYQWRKNFIEIGGTPRFVGLPERPAFSVAWKKFAIIGGSALLLYAWWKFL